MSSNDDLHGFRAETLLGDDSYILKQIADLKRDVRYSTAGNEISIDDYYKRLEDQVAKLPRIALDYAIPPGTEDEYGTRLSHSYEQVTDDCERVGNLVLDFQSRLMNAQSYIKRLRTEFGAWYILAAQLQTSNLGIKFPPNQVKALSESEFCRVAEGLDVQVESLLALVAHLYETVKSTKKIGGEKYNQGKDQVNLSYTSRMANATAPIAPSKANDMAVVPEDEDEGEVPAFVSKRPQVKEPIIEGTCNLTEIKPHVEAEPAKMQSVLDAAKPGETVVLQFKDDVSPLIAGIKDEVVVAVETPDDIASFLNQPAQAPSTPRRKLLLTEDEDLM